MKVPRNLPNALTLARLVLSGVLFWLLWGLRESSGDRVAIVATVATIVFLLAAATDAVDGFLARRFGLVTEFGRLADPFVDKVIIVGALLFFLYLPETAEFLPVWVVALIVLRELLVTAARGFISSRQMKFESDALCKIKMIVQCVTVAAFLVWLSIPAARDLFVARAALHVLVWASLVSTVLSGAAYAWKTWAILRDGAA
jgi:CDP-diacylglycerol--glycerol-3-phosphate 3-phosphatidyltransferase